MRLVAGAGTRVKEQEGILKSCVGDISKYRSVTLVELVSKTVLAGPLASQERAVYWRKSAV